MSDDTREAAAFLEFFRDRAGQPLVVGPSLAKLLQDRGLVEGEHFIVAKPLPTSAGSYGA